MARTYLDGYIAGLRAYAHWHDGVEYVGTSGTTLKAAIERATEEHGHNPADGYGRGELSERDAGIASLGVELRDSLRDSAWMGRMRTGNASMSDFAATRVANQVDELLDWLDGSGCREAVPIDSDPDHGAEPG